MSGASSPMGLTERWRQSADVALRGDFDAVMSFYGRDATWDGSNTGVGTFEGAAAIRDFLEGWTDTFEGYAHRFEVLDDLGDGVVFAVLRLEGSPAGSPGRMQSRYAFTSVWAAGLITRVIVREDIEEARADAERLAEGRE